MKLTAETARRYERKREIIYSWELGTSTSDGLGTTWRDGVDILISHNKEHKTIAATAYRVSYSGSMVRHVVDLGKGRTSALIVARECPRYSAKALAAVETEVLGLLDQVADWVGVAA